MPAHSGKGYSPGTVLNVDPSKNHNRQEYIEDSGEHSESKQGGNYDCGGS